VLQTVKTGGRIVFASHFLVFGLRCQCKQLLTSPATARGPPRTQEVHTVDKIACEHTTANCSIMAVVILVQAN